MFSVAAGGGRRHAVPAYLATVTRVFLDLQDVRHVADYEHLAAFPKQEATARVRAAETAVSLLRGNTADPHVHRFLGIVVFQARRLPPSE